MALIAEKTVECSSVPKAAGHILALDGVRGLAILSVLAIHISMLVPEGSRFEHWFRVATGFGWIGVDLFFVLSGFLITGILCDAKTKPHFFRNFYMRRVLRIFPLYYGTLAGVLLVATYVPGFGTPEAQRMVDLQAWVWLYGTNIPVTFDPDALFVLGHFWSLAVEEHFYLAWPMLVWALSRESMMKACVLAFIIALLSRFAIVIFAPAYPMGTFFLTPCRIDTLAIGAMIALAIRGPQDQIDLRRLAWKIGGASLALLLAIFLRRLDLDRGTDPIFQVAGYSLLALILGALIIFVITASGSAVLRRFFEHPIMTFFGKYSYGLYVIHVPLLIYLERNFRLHDRIGVLISSRIMTMVVFYVVCLTVCVVAAYVSYNLFEKRFLELKRFFAYTHMKSTSYPRQ